MTIELKVPHVGESIQEVQIGRWLKQPGDAVAEDESIVELETDKASLDVPAPSAGVIAKIVKQEGESVAVGETIAYLEEGDGKPISQPEKSQANAETATKPAPRSANKAPEQRDSKRPPPPDSDRGAARAPARSAEESAGPSRRGPNPASPLPATPAARRALREYGLTAAEVAAEGDRLRPADVERHVEQRKSQGQTKTSEPPKASGDGTPPPRDATVADEEVLEQVVPMSLIRKRIAKRLVEAQHTAALLTTFNEIDMSAVMELREKFRERFQERYAVKLGFMSFFVKAVIDSLKQYPGLNAEIRDGDKIAYRNYYHIGIAVGGGQGLVVPVLPHADRLSFAEVEQHIADLAQRAQQKKLKPVELEGGTFTITNGGIYGSLLSTPIVNPPQSGVLGMHAIQERPVARNGQVVVRPMMYVALTYDHRLVDGQEAVGFLKRVKEAIEDPARMLIEV